MASKLKPCPFCGQTPKTHTYNPPKNWEVTCDNEVCLVRPSTLGNYLGSDGYMTKAEAIAAWNTRAADDETVKVLELLRAFVTIMQDEDGWVEFAAKCHQYPGDSVYTLREIPFPDIEELIDQAVNLLSRLKGGAK